MHFYKTYTTFDLGGELLWVVKTLVFTLLLLLATHARLRTHDATPGNTSYMERSLFQYFLMYIYYVRFSTIYIPITTKYIISLTFYLLMSITHLLHTSTAP